MESLPTTAWNSQAGARDPTPRRDGTWLKRDRDIIAAAKERRASPHPDSEWCEADHPVVEHKPLLGTVLPASERLLLPMTCFDLEAVARQVKGTIAAHREEGELAGWMRAQIRSVSLIIGNRTSDVRIHYDPLLGFDTHEA